MGLNDNDFLGSFVSESNVNTLIVASIGRRRLTAPIVEPGN